MASEEASKEEGQASAEDAKSLLDLDDETQFEVVPSDNEDADKEAVVQSDVEDADEEEGDIILTYKHQEETFDELFTGEERDEAINIVPSHSEDELMPPIVTDDEVNAEVNRARIMSITSMNSDDEEDDDLLPPPASSENDKGRPFDEDDADSILPPPRESDTAVDECKSKLSEESAPPADSERLPTDTPARDYTAYKTKVAARLDRAVDDAALGGDLRTRDSAPLIKDYHVIKKKIRAMIAAAKDYQKYIHKLDLARNKMFEQFAVLSEETPIDAHVGKKLKENELQSIEQQGGVAVASTNEGMETQEGSAAQIAMSMGYKSLSSLQQIASVNHRYNEKDFQEHILDYMEEWEDVVNELVDKEIKEVRKLRNQRGHYTKKVDSLGNKIAKLESKGKEVQETQTEKLERNEKKLKEAQQMYEERASDLIVLLEEVTIYHWKDLYPLLKNSLKWEVNRVGRETVTYGQLPTTLDAMKATFQENVWRSTSARDVEL